MTMARAFAATAWLSTGSAAAGSGRTGDGAKPSQLGPPTARRVQRAAAAKSVASSFSSVHALFEPSLECIRTLASLIRIQPGIGLASLLLEFQLFGAVIPVADFFGEPLFHRSFGLRDQSKFA